ncbi:MAG: hypothetical protein QOF60_3096 [Actinomycetota bacterium]|jgi:hypothetical protein|nr:hypothetical protein [Actinomycetota bacterium]
MAHEWTARSRVAVAGAVVVGIALIVTQRHGPERASISAPTTTTIDPSLAILNGEARGTLNVDSSCGQFLAAPAVEQLDVAYRYVRAMVEVHFDDRLSEVQAYCHNHLTATVLDAMSSVLNPEPPSTTTAPPPAGEVLSYQGRPTFTPAQLPSTKDRTASGKVYATLTIDRARQSSAGYLVSVHYRWEAEIGQPMVSVVTPDGKCMSERPAVRKLEDNGPNNETGVIQLLVHTPGEYRLGEECGEGRVQVSVGTVTFPAIGDLPQLSTGTGRFRAVRRDADSIRISVVTNNCGTCQPPADFCLLTNDSGPSAGRDGRTLPWEQAPDTGMSDLGGEVDDVVFPGVDGGVVAEGTCAQLINRGAVDRSSSLVIP